MTVEKTVAIGAKQVAHVTFDFSAHAFTRIDLVELHQRAVSGAVYQCIYTSIATDASARRVTASIYNDNSQGYSVPFVCTLAVR